VSQRFYSCRDQCVLKVDCRRANGVFRHGGICIDRNGLRRENPNGAIDAHAPPAHAPPAEPAAAAAVRAASGIFGDNAFLRALEERLTRPGSEAMSTASTPVAHHTDLRDSARSIMSTAADWQRGLMLPFLRESQAGSWHGDGTASARHSQRDSRRRIPARLENLVKIKDCSILGKGASGTVWKVQDKVDPSRSCASYPPVYIQLLARAHPHTHTCTHARTHA
jgi:hypothetical protein